MREVGPSPHTPRPTQSLERTAVKSPNTESGKGSTETGGTVTAPARLGWGCRQPPLAPGRRRGALSSGLARQPEKSECCRRWWGERSVPRAALRPGKEVLRALTTEDPPVARRGVYE